MARIIPKLIEKMSKEEIDRIFFMDTNRDPDILSIYKEILLKGRSTYEAAKIVSKSSARSFKTLWYHAKDIERDIIWGLGHITLDSLLGEVITKKNAGVECPDELLGEFKRHLKKNEIQYNVKHIFTLEKN